MNFNLEIFTVNTIVFLVANQRTVLLVANQGTAIELGHHLAPGVLGIRISHFVPGGCPNILFVCFISLKKTSALYPPNQPKR